MSRAGLRIDCKVEEQETPSSSSTSSVQTSARNKSARKPGKNNANVVTFTENAVLRSPRQNDINVAEEEALSDDEGTNDSSIGSRKLDAIPAEVVKAFFTEVELAGGLLLQATTLKDLCNRKPEIFGYPGSPRRRQIQNKFYRVKRYHSGIKYSEYLESIGVKLAAASPSAENHIIAPSKAGGKPILISPNPCSTSPDRQTSPKLSTLRPSTQAFLKASQKSFSFVSGTMEENTTDEYRKYLLPDIF